MDSDADVDVLVARNLEARGGYERLKAIQTLCMTGAYSEAGQSYPAKILWKRPTARVVITGPVESAWVEGFNGAAWEFSRATGELRFTTGAAEAASRRGAEFDDSFVDHADKGHRVQLIRLDSVADRAAYLIRVFLADGWVKDYFLDVVSYLVIGLRKSMPLHAMGEPIESMSTAEDYRPVSGVLYPFRSVERATKTGEIMSTVQWDQIEANVTLDDAVFDPPVRD